MTGRPTGFSVRVAGDAIAAIELCRATLADSYAFAEGGTEPTLTVYCFERVTRSGLSQAGLLADRPQPLQAVVVDKAPSPYGVRLLSARFDGVLLLKDVPGQLVKAVEFVLSGYGVMPHELRARLQRPSLTSREKQVLAMVVLDLPNAEIARKLWVTESNVKNHLTAAFAKLGVRSRSAAAELILDPEAGLGPGILRITPGDEPALGP